MISTLTDDISGLRLRPSTSNPSHTLRSRPLDALQPAFLPVSHSCLPLFKNETNSGNFLLSDPNEDLSNYRPVPSPYLPHPFYPLNPVPHYQQYPQRPYSTGASLSVADSSSFQVNVGMGRHLFVGNLPFNFQWQELKDLFRQAGNIMRADVALGLDGKSRGFGTVLFATAEDAEQARRMYDGYELRGRALKVHVDRFAQASGTFQPLPPTPSQKSFYSPQPPTISSSGLQPPLISPPQAKKKPELAEVSRADAQENDLNEDREKARSELWEGDPVEVTPSGLPAGGISPIASRRPSQFKNVGKSIHDDQGPQSGPQPIGHPHNNNMLKPHSIPMPPPYDLTGDLQSGIMSPPIPKLVQITPSMPAFSFQALPSTPPLLPQFFSPGIGPSISNMREQAAPGEKVDDELQVDSVIEKLDKSATGSGMNYNPMFPIEDEKERMSNVDWGYNSQTGGNRRASFFGGAGAGHGDGEESGSMSQTSSLGFGSRMIGRGSGLQFGMAKHEIFSHAGLGNHYNNRRASFDISSLNPRAIKKANERRNRKFTSDGAAPGTGGRSVDETSTRLRVQIGTELEKQKEEDEDDAWSEDKNHEDKKAQITEIVGLGLAEPVWERTAAANSVQLSR
ncbi:hypothetical protein BY996DRAFT_6409804 [Phakopsora pachyrhizi]|nr:hypothetical protein BY996DRAFT_6409804 [Phakopsora pachyrhizi]